MSGFLLTVLGILSALLIVFIFFVSIAIIACIIPLIKQAIKKYKQYKQEERLDWFVGDLVGIILFSTFALIALCLIATLIDHLVH